MAKQPDWLSDKPIRSYGSRTAAQKKGWSDEAREAAKKTKETGIPSMKTWNAKMKRSPPPK